MVSSHLIKIRDDLIEQPETLHALVVAIQLHVELVVIGDGGEHHAHALVRLVIQVLPTAPLTSALRGKRQCKGTVTVNDKATRYVLISTTRSYFSRTWISKPLVSS